MTQESATTEAEAPSSSQEADLESSQAVDVDDAAAQDADHELEQDEIPKVDEDVSPQVDQAAPQPPKPSSGKGLLGGVLAGMVTAGLGFGAGWYVQGQSAAQLTSQIEAQGAALDALRGQVAEIPKVNLAPIEQKLTDLQALLAQNAASLETQAGTQTQALAQLRQDTQMRLDGIEVIATGGQADASQAGDYVRRVEERLSFLEQNATALTEASDALRAEADAAEAAARLAQARAGLSQIDSALASGAPFEAAVEAVAQMTEVPPALSAVASTGAPTQEGLREEWPDLARAALSSARESGESGEESGGLGSLFRKHINMRSTSPREGGSVDAILSRAEAALNQGALGVALDELAALPPAAGQTFTDWSGRAQARHDALAAAADLADALNKE